MKKILSFALVPLLAGCLSPAPRAPVNWTLEWRPTAEVASTEKPLPLTLRVSDVVVRAPYSGNRLAVLRADGSLAFDSYNVFAAAPAQLLKGAAFDAIVSSRRFATVIGRESQAHADIELEIIVKRLALDCRSEGRRDALVELSAVYVGAKGEVLAGGAGRGTAPVGADGNYSEGFSRAFSAALLDASEAITRLAQLKK